MATIADVAAKHGWRLTSAIGPDGTGTFVNSAGQAITGKFDPFTGTVKFTDQTGAGKFATASGQVGSDNFVGGHSAGDILKHMALLYGGTLGVGAGLSALGAGSDAASSLAAGSDTVTDTLPVTGVPETIDPTTGLVTSQLPKAPAAASSFGPTLAKLATGGLGLGLSLGARNSATQQNAPLNAALSAILPQLQARFAETQPLFDSTVKMAHGMLPKAYQ